MKKIEFGNQIEGFSVKPTNNDEILNNQLEDFK